MLFIMAAGMYYVRFYVFSACYDVSFRIIYDTQLFMVSSVLCEDYVTLARFHIFHKLYCFTYSNAIADSLVT